MVRVLMSPLPLSTPRLVLVKEATPEALGAAAALVAGVPTGETFYDSDGAMGGYSCARSDGRLVVRFQVLRPGEPVGPYDLALFPDGTVKSTVDQELPV